MSWLPSRRSVNSLGFTVCFLVVAYAYYLEISEGLIPCPLCTIERLLMACLGAVFFLAALHNPHSRPMARGYGVLVFVVAGVSVCIAGYHVWLQHSVSPAAPGFCLPSLSYMVEFFPLMEVLDQVFASPHSCSGIDQTFLGLSIPIWAFVIFLGLGIAGVIRNWCTD